MCSSFTHLLETFKKPPKRTTTYKSDYNDARNVHFNITASVDELVRSTAAGDRQARVTARCQKSSWKNLERWQRCGLKSRKNQKMSGGGAGGCLNFGPVRVKRRVKRLGYFHLLCLCLFAFWVLTKNKCIFTHASVIVGMTWNHYGSTATESESGSLTPKQKPADVNGIKLPLFIIFLLCL